MKWKLRIPGISMATETLLNSEEAIASNLKQFLLVLSVSLSVATLPQVFSWFRQIPYTLLLVIVGLGLALVDVRLVNLSPGLILSIFLPPLLFEAAWKLKWADVKQNLVPISLFAVLGVMITIAGGCPGIAPVGRDSPGYSATPGGECGCNRSSFRDCFIPGTRGG